MAQARWRLALDIQKTLATENLRFPFVTCGSTDLQININKGVNNNLTTSMTSTHSDQLLPRTLSIMNGWLITKNLPRNPSNSAHGYGSCMRSLVGNGAPERQRKSLSPDPRPPWKPSSTLNETNPPPASDASSLFRS